MIRGQAVAGLSGFRKKEYCKNLGRIDSERDDGETEESNERSGKR